MPNNDDFCVDFVATGESVPQFPRPRRIESRTLGEADAWLHALGDDEHNRSDLLFTLDGAAVLHANEQETAIGVGSVVLCRAGSAAFRHQGTAPWRWIRLRFSGASELVDALIDRGGHVYDLGRDPGLARQLLQYRRFAGGQPEIGLSEGSRLVMTLLARLLATFDDQSAALSRPVAQARQYIHDHVEANPSISHIAEAVGVSAEHLARLFSRELGTTPQALLMHERMKLACGLLRNTTLSIADIATRLGYTNANHFSRAFRSHVQTTPSEFRAASSIDLL
jgi:AraC-like DNA-binding protein